MPSIIRGAGDPKHTLTLNGRPVERQDRIYVPSYSSWIPVLPQSMHFIYRDDSRPRGSTLYCTCGSPGIIVGYEAYEKYNAFIGNEVIACHSFIQYGHHADNSHE